MKRIVSMLMAAMLALTCVPILSFAAEPWEGMEARSVFKNYSSADYTKDDGYCCTLDDPTLISGEYFRFTYSIDGTYTDETAPFILKPFTAQYGGWNDNFVTVGASVKQSEGEYIAYVSAAGVRESLTDGEVFGINVYFNLEAGCQTVIKDFSVLYPKTEEAPVTEADYSVTAQEVKVSNAGNVATLVVALYKDGVLIDSKNYDGSGTITAPYAADMAEALKTATDIKAFVWNNMDEIAPKGAYFESTIAGLQSNAKRNLGESIKYCENMDETKYQTSSWAAFMTALDKAKSDYASLTDDTKLTAARQTLENAKSKLLFVESTDPGSPLPFRTLSKNEVVYEMGVGWNLGNTMDGHAGFHPGETSWQQFITTKEMIRALHDHGFNTIRIPVTWGDMIDDSDYSINDGWISRVQDIVDYCVEQDMYAIINIHHDGAEQDGWLRVAADDIDRVFEKYEGVWRSIAERFKDYDEHLIFESANELTCMEGENKNSKEAMAKDTPIIMNLNQIFVNTVRATGSNNKKRWLAVVSHYANRGTSNGFALPSDNAGNGKIMFAQHIYKNTNQDTYDWTAVSELTEVVKQSRNKFPNTPIILGEYGTRNRKYTANPSGYNDIGRAYYFECAVRAGQVGATVPCTWDDSRGAGADPYETGVFTVWNRETGEPLFKTITDAMMRGMFLAPSDLNKKYDMSDIVQNPTIKEITGITPSAAELTVEVGGRSTVTADVQPADTNDVVLWKSDNDRIATVYRGMIAGTGIGETYVTAFSQSGSAEARIKVVVTAKASQSPAQTVTVDKDAYSLEEGAYEFINASAEGGEQLYYMSSDESVASVSELGKIVAKNTGTANITITAASGASETVSVTVSGRKNLNIALNIYYNGSYMGTERSAPIAITGNGEYKAVFDTTADLSSAAKAAGVKYLSDMGSMYFKDYDVDVNGAKDSPVESCSIRYDEIKVNGTPLTITKTEAKSALKGTVFDTGDPLNAWDGCAVSDNDVTIDKKKYRVNFKNIAEPTRIEIRFTISDLKFKE